MNGDEQASLLTEIRDTLREMAAVQKKEAADAAEFRAWAIKSQDANNKHLQQQKVALRIWMAFITAVGFIAFMMMSHTFENMIRQGAAKLNIPEFVLPNEKPVGGNP
jgi:hypothetical protein